MTHARAPITSAPVGGMHEAHQSGPGLLLALLGADAMRRLRQAHTDQGLKPRQFQLLMLLADGGPMAQGELGAAMETAGSIVVTLLNPLEERGLVVRERDAADRRRHVVALTEEGHRQVRSALTAQEEAEDEIFAALDQNERRQLQQLLSRIRDSRTAGPEVTCDDATRP